MKDPVKVRENLRAYRAANPEKVRAWDRARYRRDREKRLACVAEWRKAHPKRVAELKRKWQLGNKEKVAAATKRWNQTHKKECAEYARRYRELHPETKEKQRIIDQKRYVRDRQKILNYSSAWKKSHPERTLAKSKEWHARNPGKIKMYRNNRRALVCGSVGSHTVEDLHMLYLKQGRKCANLSCKKSILHGYHVDHVMPLSRGGGNGPDNLQLLCATCNLRKNSKHPDQWAKENGALFA